MYPGFGENARNCFNTVLRDQALISDENTLYQVPNASLEKVATLLLN